MNKLQVEFSKLKKQVLKACRKKHGNVRVSINIDDYNTLGLKCNIHVWRKLEIICSYYPDTVLPKQVVQYICSHDAVKQIY